MKGALTTQNRYLHITSIFLSIISLILILLSIFISSPILSCIEVILASLLIVVFIVLKKQKTAFRFFNYIAFLVLPLFSIFYALKNYEMFESFPFLSISLYIGVLCTGIVYCGTTAKNRILEFIICFLFFSISAFGIISFANVELDPHEVASVQGTVTQKFASSGISGTGYCFSLDVQTESYGTLRVAATYEQSRSCEIGDTIELSVGQGLFGKGYYYYGFIGDKEYYDWRIIIPDDNEFYNYADSLPYIN